MGENTSKEHEELLIDVDSTASDINAIDTTRSKGEEISAYHSDVTPDRPTANMKDRLSPTNRMNFPQMST